MDGRPRRSRPALRVRHHLACRRRRAHGPPVPASPRAYRSPWKSTSAKIAPGRPPRAGRARRQAASRRSFRRRFPRLGADRSRLGGRSTCSTASGETWSASSIYLTSALPGARWTAVPAQPHGHLYRLRPTACDRGTPVFPKSSRPTDRPVRFTPRRPGPEGRSADHRLCMPPVKLRAGVPLRGRGRRAARRAPRAV